MFPSRLFHSAPRMHPVGRFSSSFRGRFRLSASRDWHRLPSGRHFSNLPAYASSIYLARCLRAKEPLYRAVWFTFPSSPPVGCLISHPLNTFFIARLTISDNARLRGRGETKESATTARPIRDRLTNVRKPAWIDIGSPRSRYTSAINHISR